MVGSRVARFVDASDRAAFETLLTSGHGRQRCRLIGASRAFEVSLSLSTTVSTSGDRLNLIVTDLRELLEANHDRDRAERDSRTKDEFLAMLAHELRNPLGAISNAARVLAASPAEGQSSTDAEEVIARQVSHISFLIDELLDVERVVSGKIRLNRQPLDMAVAVRHAVAGFNGVERANRHIEISTEPVWIDGDTVRLEQVVTNLLTNAFKYTPPGGRIQVALRADGGDAVFSVEDTGVGISQRLLPFIFDLYVQAERTLDRAAGGLGIGLSLVRRLVELHGGRVEASSKGEGHGSLFTVRLKQIHSPNQSPVMSVPRERRVRPRRVLLIEDSGDAREMLRMLLEFAGHVVFAAADGVRGLELMSAVRPDVGIVDLNLPGMDGYQVAKQIRRDPDGRHMLLVALTGDGFQGDSVSSEDGFDHHLVKPVDPNHLERLLSENTEAFQKISP